MSARHDLLALGASLLSQEQLVALIAKGLAQAEVQEACRALSLHGDARTRALLDHRAGERLMAALELGRRACIAPTLVRGRVRGLTDAVGVLRPLLADDSSALGLLVLDARMRVVHASSIASASAGALLRRTLAVGGTRLVVGCVAAGPAVPRSEHVDRALELARAARVVDCTLVDWLILGDDGAASLARLGLIDPGDVRYR